jgi:alkylhydroperoxidase/carboxymuconolactone decarboxylase family protein YurZ
MADIADFQKFYDDMIGYMPPRIRARVEQGLEINPEITGQIEELRMNALTPDCLDQLTVQLIAFVVLLTQRAPAAVNHAKAAIKVGATREQLHAAAMMAFVFGGLGPLNLSGEMIAKAFEE